MILKTLFPGLLLLVTFLMPVLSVAQSAESSSDSGALPTDEVREAVGSILLGGLVGGVLGLSTLSFYEKPQDNIRNITLGAGAGVILASIYLTFNVIQSSQPKSNYGGGELGSSADAYHIYPLVSYDRVGLAVSY